MRFTASSDDWCWLLHGKAGNSAQAQRRLSGEIILPTFTVRPDALCLLSCALLDLVEHGGMIMKQLVFAALAALLLAVPSAWSQQTSDQQAQEQRMQQMQERMKKMQQEMDQIQQAKDPKERQRLMQQHMQTMQEQMRDMRMMGGPMMMGMMGPGMHGRGHGMMGDPEARQKMMEDRMDMMQMMMEQMMEQMQMQGGTPKK